MYSRRVDDEDSYGKRPPMAFRNQFLLNAGSTQGARSNSRSDSASSFDFTHNDGSFSQWDTYSPYEKRKDDASVYELDTLQKSGSTVLPEDRTMNPFESYDQHNSNPFDRDNVPLPDAPYTQVATGPLSDEELEMKKIRKNERARLKQMRRKPWFHYSKIPFITAIFTLIQIIVFIVELAKMSHLTGSAFQTQPYFNPMLGPSIYLLINMGARYVPCMSQIKGITDDLSINFPCPNSTTISTDVCSLNELCGLSGIPVKHNNYIPSQWYRIVTPIFLHAGFLHIIFNLLLQVSMGWSIEQHVGLIKFLIIYMLSGISGFLLGANFAPDGMASTGASGLLFGIVACNILMFIYCGRKNSNIYGTKHYKTFIFIMVCEIVISFVLGLLPGLDNFSHIGGFAMGILVSVLLLPDPSFIYADGIINYNSHDNTFQQFVNKWNPYHNYQHKVPWRFYLWCILRIICLVLAIVYFVLLVDNFFKSGLQAAREKCKWCKYINCIPVHGWCDLGEVSVLTQSTKRNFAGSSALVVLLGFYYKKNYRHR